MSEPPEQSLRRNRDFGLLFTGATVNGIGDWLLELALPLYVFVETGSGIATAGVYIAKLIVRLVVGPLGGSLADRWPLRTTLVTTNLLQILALVPLFAVSTDRIWLVFIVVVAQGMIGSVNDPAGFALMPRIVGSEQLIAANSTMSAGDSVARLIGAAAGGIAVEVGGPSAVVLAGSATFVVGAVSASLMSRRTNQPSMTDDSGSVDTSIRAGLAEVRKRPAMAALIGVQGLAMFGFGAFPVLFIVFVTESLDGDGSDVGLIRASSALGGLIAAAVVGSFASKRDPAQVMSGGYLLFAVVAFLFVNAPSVTTVLWVYLLLFAMSGFPNVASQVGTRSTAQQLCPSEVLGRLGGLMSASGALGMGLGSVAAGLLLEVFSARILFNGQVVVLALCGAFSFLFIAQRAAGTQQGPAIDR